MSRILRYDDAMNLAVRLYEKGWGCEDARRELDISPSSMNLVCDKIAEMKEREEYGVMDRDARMLCRCSGDMNEYAANMEFVRRR